ncbi:MAG: hypothetical protein ABI904_00890 [Chloroflexota bacterium]
MTSNELKLKAERLQSDLTTIEADITAARAVLNNAASQTNSDPQTAQNAAARLMVLEARKAATLATIEANARETERNTAKLNSKEYKDGHKRMVEIERKLQEYADDNNNILSLMRDNGLKADALAQELFTLVDSYCLDLDTPAKSNRKQNKDYLFILSAARLIKPHFDNLAYTAAMKQPRREEKNPNAKKQESSKYFEPNPITA